MNEGGGGAGVFVNCPFDAAYKPIFDAIVFTALRCGFTPRCALESDDAAENRFAKIARIIEACPYGVHDISRTDSDGEPPLPRFNMPFELGLFLGAHRFGKPTQKVKRCIVFDTERFRYQRFLSDIAGQDIHAHNGRPESVIDQLAAWFREQRSGTALPGGAAIHREYRKFNYDLPAICAARDLRVDELTFGDFTALASGYLASVV